MKSSRGHKTICIAFASEAHYQDCMQDEQKFHKHLKHTYLQHPALFPQAMGKGYKLNGFSYSKKQNIRMRRIKLAENGAAYQIRPSFLMPYMIGRTDAVEKGLRLRQWAVPFEVIADLFSRDPMYWYRAYVSLGRHSIVGTTIKSPDKLPSDVLADEKHTRHKGQRIYVPTTVAQGCILGADLTDNAGIEALTQGYKTFQQEAHQLDPSYSPDTVNTDGWGPTQTAWKTLFPQIVIILCFLHAFLKIKERCQRSKAQLYMIGSKVWDTYHAQTVAQFSQRIRRLREWSQHHLTGSVQQKVLDLCHKAPRFKIAFHFPTAYRTSNALDRLMNYQDRVLYAMQYFHGDKTSARQYVRAMALAWNFHPYGQKTQIKYSYRRLSPFEGLNGFRYHDNWLHNLLIAASIGGQAHQTQNPI
jgi:hypothetical protein